MTPAHPQTRISVLSLAAALLLAPWALSAQAQGVEARVVQTQGEVLVDGRPAQLGMDLKAATVKTGADGRLQLRTADGSLLALPPGSEARLAADQATALTLVSGGLRLNAAREWRIALPDRSLRTNGYIKLQHCGSACSLPAAVYGRVLQGEAVLEYQGGRSVLRARSFRWDAANQRPVVLARAPAALDDADSQTAATRVRTDVAAALKTGIEAFGNGDDAAATKALQEVSAAAPGETLVSYYLGLIALRAQNTERATQLLQQYAREDPEGAASREVPKTLTLLSSVQLQQEVANAVAREREVVGTPPEPGSIAVQAFVNKGNDAYAAMAKGLAAMIIADLAKVPGLKVLEREKVQLLVNEAKLGDSGLADTASAVRSGRLMRAEKVVVGNFEVQ